MFKRGPIIVVGIIAVLLLAAPFAIGMFTENGVRQQLEQQSRNPSFAATVESYDRGWFSSQARLNYGLSETYVAQMQDLVQDLPPGLLSSITIPIIVDFKHGPVLFEDGFGIGSVGVRAYVDPENQIAQFAEQVLGMPYLFHFRGRGGFGTGFNYEGEIPPLDNAFGDLSFAFSGFDFSGESKSQDLVFAGIMENLSVQSPYASGLIDSIAVNVDYEYRDDEVPLSDGAITIGRITAINPLMGAEPIFSASNLMAGGSMKENDAGTHLDMQVIYSVANLVIADAIELSDASIGMGINHIDPAAAKQLSELSTQLGGVVDPEQVLALLMPVVEQMVAGGASLSIEPLKFSMPEGDFDARMNLSLDPGAIPPEVLANPQMLPLALGAVTADLDLTVSKTMAEYLGGLLMAQQMVGLTGPDGEPMSPDELEAMGVAQVSGMLAGLAAQGLVVDNGASYSTSIRFADGVAMANGQPVPLGF